MIQWGPPPVPAIHFGRIVSVLSLAAAAALFARRGTWQPLICLLIIAGFYCIASALAGGAPTPEEREDGIDD